MSEVMVPAEAHGSPFAGMTVTQALLLNSAVCGLPVEVFGGRQDEGRPEVYIFSGIRVSGSYGGPFECIGDLILTRAERLDDCWVPRYGIRRVLSAVLVRRFTVLSIEPTYHVCSACGTAVPLTEKVYDVGGLGQDLLADGDWEWQQRIECKDCW